MFLQPVCNRRIVTNALRLRPISDDETRTPEDDDESVEDVEAVADVSEQSLGEHLHQHFHGEQTTEEQIAVLQHKGVRLRLHTTPTLSVILIITVRTEAGL